MNRARTIIMLITLILCHTYSPGRSAIVLPKTHHHQSMLTTGPAVFGTYFFSTELYVDDDFTPAQPGWGITHFATISDALAVSATGDNINIYSGVYAEELTISTPVGLLALTGESPVMDGTGLAAGTAVTISTSGVIVEGLTIRDYHYGIVITPAGNALVNQCRIFDNLLYGMLNQNPTLISDATNCWWGASSGPYDASDDRSTGGLYNPNGLGNQSSDNINYYPWSVNVTFSQKPVGFGLYNTTCETLEVRIKPLSSIESNTTMFLFTVRWEAGTVNILDVSSPLFNLTLDNLVTGIGGYNYAVFSSNDFTPVSLTAGVEVAVLTFVHDGSGTGFTDFEIVMDNWTLTNNADPYIELMGTDYSGNIYHKAENVYLDDCDNPELQALIMLEGPYDSLANLMKTDINPDIPLNQPYFYPPWSYTGTENLASIPANMADWVLVELRATPAGPAIDRSAGILLNDGMIMDASLNGKLRFNGITASSPYYVVIHHRNHLPVMSNLPVIIPNPEPYNFADTLNFPPYGTGKKALSRLEAGVYGLISGDVNNDGRLRYSGPQNDRGLIMNLIYYMTGSPVITQTINGYYKEDLTMDDIVKYSGPNNDQREIILNLVELTGSSSLTGTFQCVVPGYSSRYGIPSGPQADFTGQLADIGIFEYTAPDELVIKVRPENDIPGYGLTNIQFTVMWPATSNVFQLWPVANTINSTYNILPQGPVTLADGYYHQIFAAANGTPLSWSANVEYPVLVLKYFYTTGDCTEFEIGDDTWTNDNNGVYYFELIGQNRTGTRYQPIVQIVSEGGQVDGSQEICMGTSTGMMILVNYSGTVNKWQKSFNSGSWADIPGTAGLASYSELPGSEGSWEYRAEVQKFGCTPDYSDPAVIDVVIEAIWTGNSDNDWDNASNWNVCGIPVPSRNAIIPDVTPRPFPFVTAEGYCSSLRIKSGATVTISPAGSVYVGNSIINGAFRKPPLINKINY